VRDVWSEPNPGLRYLHRTTTTPCHVHVLLVDLRAPGVHIVATPYDDRWSTVADVARDGGYAAAINGGFWGAFQRPRGLAAGGGELWPTAAVDPEMGFFSVDDRGRPILRAPGEEMPEGELERIREAVSGRPILVRAGEIDAAALDSFPTANDRQPRTAVGLTEDRRNVILVVVDGRRRESRGMTLYELSRVLVELGAHDAINLDGGGSSEMYVAASGGVVNVPSRGRWEAALDEALGDDDEVREVDGRSEVLVRGVEREVLNHLAIVAPPPASMAPRPIAPLDGVPAMDPPAAGRSGARPPALRLGTLRETLVPILYLAPPLLGAAAVAIVVRKRRRRGALPRRPSWPTS
jgi:hypothetical protein